MAYNITMGTLTLQSWTIGELFSKDGTHKVYLVEHATCFTLVEQGPSQESTKQTFSLEEVLAERGVPAGVYTARNPALLDARRECYTRAVTALNAWVCEHKVRYPSPTPFVEEDGHITLKLNPHLRGSPFLALALATQDEPRKPWAVLYAGQVWKTLSADTIVGLESIAYQLRGCGRVTVRLNEQGPLKITRIAPGNRLFSSVEELPIDRAFH